jgi:transposase-like protein
MTVKDDLHHLVDELDEDEARNALAYLLGLRHAALRASSPSDSLTAADEDLLGGDAEETFTTGGGVSDAAVRGTRRNRWTSSQIQEALRLYSETGKPVTEIFRQIDSRMPGSSPESGPSGADTPGRQPLHSPYDSTPTTPNVHQSSWSRRRLNEAQEIEVTCLYAETDTPVPEIAERFGIGESSVYRVAQRHGAALRGRGGASRQVSDDREILPISTRHFGSRRKLTESQELEVTRLYAETDTPVPEIAERFGIGESSVYRVAQRHGAALRGRGGLT